LLRCSWVLMTYAAACELRVEQATLLLVETWELEIWEMGKGRLGGEWSVGGLMEMGLAKFLIFLSNSWNRFGFIDFTEFGRFWLVLLIFEFLTWFYMLYMCWLVKLYDFTNKLVFLITMTCVIHPPRGVDGDYRSFACFGSHHLIFDWRLLGNPSVLVVVTDLRVGDWLWLWKVLALRAHPT